MRKFNMQLITFVMSFNTVAMSACDCNIWYGSREVAHAVEDISSAAIHTLQYVSLNWWCYLIGGEHQEAVFDELAVHRCHS